MAKTPSFRTSRFPDLSLPAMREVFFFTLRARRWPHLGASKLSESLHLLPISTIVPFALTGRVFLPTCTRAVSAKSTPRHCLSRFSVLGCLCVFTGLPWSVVLARCSALHECASRSPGACFCRLALVPRARRGRRAKVGTILNEGRETSGWRLTANGKARGRGELREGKDFVCAKSWLWNSASELYSAF